MAAGKVNGKGTRLKRIFLIWFAANFVIAGLFALFTGGWYLRLPTFAGMVAELGLVTLPNLFFPSCFCVMDGPRRQAIFANHWGGSGKACVQS